MITATLPRRRKVIRLHRAQQEFCRSRSLYRGFVGGRGSGKSWAGAYDLIRRARRGRTYLVGSPTSVLMQDTTFPTFKKLAQDLGVWGSVKLSPYPNVSLTTGATVRFRTAEDPEKMRGPNLSGVWLDEGSLMAKGAYDVCIAALREEGEQGWLSSTFTPKGFGHWSYETFGTGRPDTAMFHARTGDNPFLPAGFQATLERQYSGLRAAQELGGKFVNMEGAEWPPEYFGDEIWASAWPTQFIASALALDPALGHGERGRPPAQGREPKPGCFASFCFAGVDVHGVVWVDCWMSQTWDAQALVSQAFLLHQQTGAQAVSVETNGGQEFLAELILTKARQDRKLIPLYGINNIEDKEVRIRAKVGPFLAQRRLRLRRGSRGAELLVQQLRDFPVGEYKDGPDSLAMALTMLDFLLGQLYGGAQPRALRA